MRGSEGFLFAVLLPCLFLSIFGFAAFVEIRRDWRNRTRWTEGLSGWTASTAKRLFKVAALSILWIIPTLFVVCSELRIHYDLWALQPEKVMEIDVGEHQFRDRHSVAELVYALKSSEWYSVNHGGWGDETPIVIKTASGTEWQMRAGYHFAQHGAVVLRSSGPGGRGWQLGTVFSPALPGVLERIGAPLSHCDTAHHHPCVASQASSH